MSRFRERRGATTEERRALGRLDIIFEKGATYHTHYNNIALMLVMGGVVVVLGLVAFLLLGEAVKEYPLVFAGGGVAIALAFGVVGVHRSRQMAKLRNILDQPDWKD